jgi:predicted TIM-barrel fold metal-dependent hydrolase
MTTPCFDSHFHILDPQFPTFENNGYMPPAFTAIDYFQHHTIANHLSLAGGAIVSGSFQLFDQTYLLDAIHTCGYNYVGVTQLPMTVSDADIFFLHSKRVRAVRFNIARGVTSSIEEIQAFSLRIFNLCKMHSEFYLDSCLLSDRKCFQCLSGLPLVVIDHLGLTYEGQHNLIELLSHGKEQRTVFTKLTGFMRYNGSESQLRSFLILLIKSFPDQLLFGTDLPSTRASRVFGVEDIGLLTDCIRDACDGMSDESICRVTKKIFLENAEFVYLSSR